MKRSRDLKVFIAAAISSSDGPDLKTERFALFTKADRLDGFRFLSFGRGPNDLSQL